MLNYRYGSRIPQSTRCTTCESSILSWGATGKVHFIRHKQNICDIVQLYTCDVCWVIHVHLYLAVTYFHFCLFFSSQRHSWQLELQVSVQHNFCQGQVSSVNSLERTNYSSVGKRVLHSTWCDLICFGVFNFLQVMSLVSPWKEIKCLQALLSNELCPMLMLVRCVI